MASPSPSPLRAPAYKGLDGLGGGDTISDISSVTSGRLGQIQRSVRQAHLRTPEHRSAPRAQRAGDVDANNTRRTRLRKVFEWRPVGPRCGVWTITPSSKCLRDQPLPRAQQPRRRRDRGDSTASDPGRFLQHRRRELFWASPGRLTAASGTPVTPTASRARPRSTTRHTSGSCVPISDGAKLDHARYWRRALASALRRRPSRRPPRRELPLRMFVWNDSGSYPLSRGPAWTN